MNEEPNQRGLIGRAWSYVCQAWLVILLALLYGGALAGVQSTLGPMIAKNKENETYDRIPDLVPGADREKTVEVNTDDPLPPLKSADGKRQQRLYQAVAADGTDIGWVLPASGLGFADRIDLLIGLDLPVSKITGLWVLEQKETPGLGDRIREPEFRSHFTGQPTDRPLATVKPSARTDPEARVDGEIVAVTGATISSESVARIVNEAIQRWKEPIRRVGRGAVTPPESRQHGEQPGHNGGSSQQKEGN